MFLIYFIGFVASFCALLGTYVVSRDIQWDAWFSAFFGALIWPIIVAAIILLIPVGIWIYVSERLYYR